MENEQDVIFINTRKAVVMCYPSVIRAGKKKTAKYICVICGHEIRRGATYCSACRLDVVSLRKRKFYKYMPAQRLEQILKERMVSEN